MRWCCLALLFAAIPLMGVSATEATGCSCGSAGTAVSTGGVATSKSYMLNRSGIGSTFEMATSATKTYRSNSAIGDYLSEGATSSDSYSVRHTLSQAVVADPATVETTDPASTTEETDPATTADIMAKTPDIELAAPTPSEEEPIEEPTE